jgi:peptidoglycan hydrolase-like protein with peptidoglycan-binding domain
MSNPTEKAKVSGRGPTPAQRAWLSKLEGLEAIAASNGDDDAAAGPAQKNRITGVPVGLDNPFNPTLLQLGSEVLDIIKKIAGGKRVCVVEVVNKTNRTMFQGVPKHEGGGFLKLPPPKIEPGKSGVFVAASVSTIPVIGVLKEGCIGKLPWIGFDLDTEWTIGWRFPVVGGNTGTAELDGTNAFKYTKVEPEFTTVSENDVREYRFTLLGGDGPSPKPGPEPGPTPGQDVRSNCIITVNNKTKFPLNLVKQDHERGGFLTFPPDTIAPGGSAQFVSVETPRAKEQGCKGFVIWEVGSPSQATWRIDWDNPEEAKNTAKATLDPQKVGFKSLEQIGQDDENVPAVFTISGGGDGPGPGPDPGPEPEFKPPVEAKQPTLRKGDKSKDGWVEYMQMLLNFHIKSNLETDGDFGTGTLNAVIKFQQQNKLQVDGVCGNQTWAALREGAPEKPGSDGRKPHTFVEEGEEARWSLESEFNNRYFKDTDEFNLAIDSVGDTLLDENLEATVRVTAPGAKAKVTKAKIGSPQKRSSPSALGRFYILRVKDFRKRFPSVPVDAKITDYLVEAYLPQELGGDLYTGKVQEP